MRIKQLVVRRIEWEGNRILLYGDSDDYHLIARPDCQVSVGDRVTYEPYGVNFGFLVEEER